MIGGGAGAEGIQRGPAGAAGGRRVSRRGVAQGRKGDQRYLDELRFGGVRVYRKDFPGVERRGRSGFEGDRHAREGGGIVASRHDAQGRQDEVILHPVEVRPVRGGASRLHAQEQARVVREGPREVEVLRERHRGPLRNGQRPHGPPRRGVEAVAGGCPRHGRDGPGLVVG